MSLSVLIVEDETLIALELEGIFLDAGHAVVGMARTMTEALAVAGGHPRLDLAIMDVNLASGPDGVDTAQRLREEHDVACLFVSARLDDETRARALVWKPVGFVSKPFVEREILRAVDHLQPRQTT